MNAAQLTAFAEEMLKIASTSDQRVSIPRSISGIGNTAGKTLVTAPKAPDPTSTAGAESATVQGPDGKRVAGLLSMSLKTPSRTDPTCASLSTSTLSKFQPKPARQGALRR